MAETIKADADDRDAVRASCAHDIYVEAIGDDTYPGVLMNISTTGFQAMVDGQLSIGTMIRLQFTRAREATAVVVWRRGTIIGCQFTEPLSRTAMKAVERGFGLASYGMPTFGFGDGGAPGR